MRRTRLKARNPERRRATFDKAFGPKGAWIRRRPCLVPGCPKHTVAAHAIGRGMGSAKGTSKHLVPLCWLHHVEAGEYRTSARAAFQSRHRIACLVEIAAELEQAWQGGDDDYNAPF